jgi:hypothetical protein
LAMKMKCEALPDALNAGGVRIQDAGAAAPA